MNAVFALNAEGVLCLTQSVVIPRTRSPVIYRATVASFINRCVTTALLCNTSRIGTKRICARALRVLLVELVARRGESVRIRGEFARCAWVSPRSVDGTGRHGTECKKRLNPVRQSQRPTPASASSPVFCVSCKAGKIDALRRLFGGSAHPGSTMARGSEESGNGSWKKQVDDIRKIFELKEILGTWVWMMLWHCEWRVVKSAYERVNVLQFWSSKFDM